MKRTILLISLLVICLFNQGCIIQKGPDKFTIRYYDSYFGEGFITEQQYDKKDGVLPEELLTLEKEGYILDGWYTKSQGGEKIEYIASDEAKDYVLYAHWKVEEYEIVYLDVAQYTTENNPNPKSYTIEQSFDLQPAEWTGLKFSHWIDSNGEEIKKIDKGTTGKIVLTACWMNKENLVIQTDLSQNSSVCYDEKEGKYYFIYKIGIIDNIVLDTIGGPFKKEKGQQLSITENINKTTSTEISEAISTTVTEIVTKNNNWSVVKEKIEGISSTTSTDITVSGSGKGLIELAIGTEFGFSVSDINQWNSTTSKGGDISIGSEQSDTINSTVAHNYTVQYGVEAGLTVDSEMPEGSYKYVCMGKAHVYMIVTYDPAEDIYYLNTYTMFDKEVSKGIIYQVPSDSSINIKQSDSLSYDEIPVEDYQNIVNSSYFVKFESSDKADGEMPISVFRTDMEEILPQNKFNKTGGYEFLGWSTSKNGKVEFTDMESVKNLTEAKNIITLYAVWGALSYSVELNANGGECSSQRIEVVYGDEYGELPEAKKTGYDFLGWFKKETGVEQITENTKVEETKDHTLYAIFKPKTYKIYYDSNGGQGTMSSKTYVFDEYSVLSENKFDLIGHEFIGWSLDKEGKGKIYTADLITKYKNISENGENIILYAIWKMKVKGSYSWSNFKVGFDNDYSYDIVRYFKIDKIFDIKKLKEEGYKNVKITFNFTVDALDGHSVKAIYKIITAQGNSSNDNLSNLVSHKEFSVILKDGADDSILYSESLPIELLLSNNRIGLYFTADGINFVDFGDNQYDVKNLKITIEFIK